jgi:Subtilase family
LTRAAIVLAALAALATAPPALAARAANAPREAPGLLSIGAYEHTLVQFSRGSPATAEAVLVSRRHRIWRLPTPTAQRLLPGLLARGVVQAVEPDRAVTLLHAEADPLASLEYWRPLVGADRVVPPGPGRAVTVLDTGLDLAHAEFAGRPNTSVLGTQSLADTRTEFHGTAVSSIVGAQENGVGVVGVYPQAVVRSGDVRQLTVSQVIGALDAAVRAGPSVINMSFGVPYSRLFEDLVLTAFGAGSIVVAAAGNERQQGNTAASPANLNHVLTIAATDQQDRPTTFSTASLGVDLAAPGVDIPAAVPTAFSPSGYSLMSGTSFSAPIVAGATAWVWTVRAQLDNTQVFDLMRYSARDVPPRGFDRDTGFGLLDIPSALGDEAPSSDHQEPNDDIRQVRAGGLFTRATAPATSPSRPSASFTARLDVTEDPEDVYRIYVPAGRLVRATVTPDTDVDVDLWRPSATSVFLRGRARARQLFASSGRDGRRAETVSVRNRGRVGFYAYLDVYLPRNGPLDAEYRVNVVTSR